MRLACVHLRRANKKEEERKRERKEGEKEKKEEIEEGNRWRPFGQKNLSIGSAFNHEGGSL